MTDYLDPGTWKALGGVIGAIGSSIIVVKRWTANVDAGIDSLRVATKALSADIADAKAAIGSLAMQQAQLAKEQTQMRQDHSSDLHQLDDKMGAIHRRLDDFQRDLTTSTTALTGKLGEVSGKLSVLLDSNRGTAS